MEELKKHKIFTMEDTKRNVLLTVAMRQFAKNGYKKTTTDEIILEAEISKGLLFHYFGTKKDLYIFLFQYANTTIMDEYFARIDFKERDILERLRRMFLLKLELTQKYPAIFDFVTSAFYEEAPAVAVKVNAYTKQWYFDVQNKMLADYDASLFKVNIDPEKALNVFLFTLRGYSGAQASPKYRMEDYSKEYARYRREIEEYIIVLRTAFYQEA